MMVLTARATDGAVTDGAVTDGIAILTLSR